MCDELVEDVRHLLRPRVADECAVEPGKARPVERRRRLALVFVPPDECDRVAAARVRDGNAGVAGKSDTRRDTWHDLEPHALLVEEQRL